MTMTTADTRTHGREAARARKRSDEESYRALFRAVVREATSLNDLSERLRALEREQAYKDGNMTEVEV